MARRRSGLGAPPEAHERLAKQHLESATDLARGAKRDADDGRCNLALAIYTDAAKTQGSALAHIHSLHGRERDRFDPSYEKVARELFSARAAISSCFVKGKR